MKTIRVFLADWQILFREGIHFTFSGEEDINVIGEAVSNEEALRAIESSPPDIVILNANRDEISGTEAARRIRLNQPSVKVILIMDQDNEDQLFLALKGGAAACLTKEIDPSDLVAITRKVAQGTTPISEALLRPDIATRTINEFEDFTLLGKDVNNLIAPLTPQEIEILRHIADGNNAQQVSKSMDISDEVLAEHLNMIANKLVNNDHTRHVIGATQQHIPSVMPISKPGVQYITKDEFNEFKKSLKELLKLFTKD